MKELSIEEKAKAYDEALKVLHKYDGANIMFTQDLKEEIFPELKESKDERIRKALIKYLKERAHSGFNQEVRICNEGIAWLEKQGKHKSDNIEPKFKVGDWVVSPNGVYWHIDAIQDGRYEVTADTGQCADWPLDTNIYRLWTIQDAKDGDVLAEDSCIFIIEKMKSNRTAIVHCCLFDDGDFDSGSTLGFDVDSTYPATKEQRDTLFAEIKDAGYEWDAENKELERYYNY